MNHLKATKSVYGAGLGFRRDLAESICTTPSPLTPDFIECAPENWMGIGGKWKKLLKAATERLPLTCHGLSMSLGSPDPLDMDLLKRIKLFLSEYTVSIFSEHLSFCSCDNAHLYDLLPIPFRSDAVRHVADRIGIVQDYLERPIAIENVSYYLLSEPEMSEAEFIQAVITEAKCDLLLDVNNVYVNSVNHSYDPKEFISALPLERVTCIHMAGHLQVSDNLIIDTHGAAIVDPVYDLLAWTLKKTGPRPVLLERDFNFDNVSELNSELEQLRQIITKSEVPRAA